MFRVVVLLQDSPPALYFYFHFLLNLRLKIHSSIHDGKSYWSRGSKVGGNLVTATTTFRRWCRFLLLEYSVSPNIMILIQAKKFYLGPVPSQNIGPAHGLEQTANQCVYMNNRHNLPDINLLVHGPPAGGLWNKPPQGRPLVTQMLPWGFLWPPRLLHILFLVWSLLVDHSQGG